MEGKANVLVSNLDDEEKESVTLTYVVKDCGDEETAKSIKKEIDNIIEEHGGDTHTQDQEEKKKIKN